MIKLKLYRYNELACIFYYMTVDLLPHKNEIVIMHDGNRLSLNELNDMLFSCMRVEVVIENEKDINVKGVVNNE